MTVPFRDAAELSVCERACGREDDDARSTTEGDVNLPNCRKMYEWSFAYLLCRKSDTPHCHATHSHHHAAAPEDSSFFPGARGRNGDGARSTRGERHALAPK